MKKVKYIVAILFLAACSAQQKRNETFGNMIKPVKKATQQILPQIDSIKKLIEEGDIIFRGGTDIESDIIRNFSSKDKMFSHCGIALKNNGVLKITHILGGSTNPDGTILTQAIEDFVAYPDNESAGVYKSNLSANELGKLHFFIDSLKKTGVLFDLKFDLFTKDKLYCTEMVIDALQYAKKTTALFKPTIFKLKKTKYEFIANAGDNFYFYPIDVFQKQLTAKQVIKYPNYTGR